MYSRLSLECFFSDSAAQGAAHLPAEFAVTIIQQPCDACNQVATMQDARCLEDC